jgi:cytochrome c-type biogenesis protein CcmE
MLTKKVKSRIKFLALLLTISILVIFLILNSLRENVVYFFSPTEIYNMANIKINEKIRIGGLVKEDSVNKNSESMKFVITDLKNEIIVYYEGLVPNLFSEGKGVIAEGKFYDKKFFIANNILAKHDENYMPPEVANILNN